jgi:mono/diheme cytochrome c family protein
MKKTMLVIITGMALTAITLAFTTPSEKPVRVNPQEETAMFPENIEEMFETSCYDCHGGDATNAKAKAKLNFGNWSEMSASKKVGKIEGLKEVIMSGDMPPARYIGKKPEAAFTQEQKDTIAKWAGEETDKLLGTGK